MPRSTNCEQMVPISADLGSRIFKRSSRTLPAVKAFANLARSFDQYTISDPRCGVPRKMTPATACSNPPYRIAFSCATIMACMTKSEPSTVESSGDSYLLENDTTETVTDKDYLALHVDVSREYTRRTILASTYVLVPAFPTQCTNLLEQHRGKVPDRRPRLRESHTRLVSVCQDSGRRDVLREEVPQPHPLSVSPCLVSMPTKSVDRNDTACVMSAVFGYVIAEGDMTSHPLDFRRNIRCILELRVRP